MRLVSFLLALTSGPSQPAPVPLEPSGPWVVEGQEKLCMLSRSFGPDGAKVTIGFQPLFTDPRMEVFVITADPSHGRREGDAKATLSSGEPADTGHFISIPTGDGKRLARLTLPARLLTQARQADSLTLAFPTGTIAVRMTRLAAGAAALDGCEHQLLKSWGIDDSALSPERAPHMLGNAHEFGPESYPALGVTGNLQGRVTAALQITADGRVSACRVVASAGPALDTATCKRAVLVRFKPGTDATGAAAASVYMLTVRWALPTH